MRRSATLQTAISALVVALVFGVALPRLVDYADVWSAATAFDRRWLVPLLFAAAFNLIAPSTAQVVALPGLRFGRAVQADWASSALVNVAPLGSAMALGLTWTMYRRWGLGRGDIGRAAVLTGLWDLMFKLLTPGLALVWLATEQPIEGRLLEAALVGVVLFVAGSLVVATVMGHPAPAVRIGRLVGRLPRLPDDLGDRLADAREDTIDLVRSRWRALTVWTVLGHLNLAGLLLVCLRGVGIDGTGLTPAAVFAAFTFGRLVTALPITPGGLGILELGLVAALTFTGSFGPQAPTDQLVAAVLVFRVLSFILPIPLGLAAWLVWARRNRAGATQPD